MLTWFGVKPVPDESNNNSNSNSNRNSNSNSNNSNSNSNRISGAKDNMHHILEVTYPLFLK